MKKLEKVLHVDDDEDIVEITRIALSTIGELVTLHCMSGAEAIEKAPSFSPDLFLLDHRMPEMDGEETWRRLKRLPGMEEVPVIFLTALVHSELTDHLIEEGALGVITKPFDPLELSELIQKMWARRPESGEAR